MRSRVLLIEVLAVSVIVAAGAVGAAPAAHSAVAPNPAPYWGAVTAPTGGATIYNLAVSPSDVPIVVGSVGGTGYFPTGPNPDDSIAVTSAQSSPMIAALSTDDSYFEWAKGVASTGNGLARAVAVTSDDTIVITGSFTNTLTFPLMGGGSTTLTSAGGTDIFVAAIGINDNSFAWAQRAGGSGADESLTVAVTGSGGVAIGGQVVGTVTFPQQGGGSISMTAGATGDAFVAYMSPQQSGFAWAQHSGNPTEPDYAMDLAISRDDTIYVTGMLWPALAGSTVFPTGPGTSISLAPPTLGQFVAAMNVDDSYFDWARDFSYSYSMGLYGIDVSRDDSVVLGGSFGNTMTLPTEGGGTISLTSSGGLDAFVAMMNGRTGYFTWAQQIKGVDSQFGNTVSFTQDDTILLTGAFTGTTYFPASADDSFSLTPASGRSLYVASIPKDDTYFDWAQAAWADGGGGVADSEAAWVASLSTGTPVATGRFGGNVQLPTSASTSVSTSRTFVGVLGRYPLTGRPGPPRNATASRGNGSATVAWDAPFSAGTSPITSYTVIATPGGTTCTAPAATPRCAVPGLINGTTYTFQVRAVSAAGAGPWSTASNAVTPTSQPPPCAPTAASVGADVVLTFDDTSGTCEWTPPSWVTSVRVLVVGGGGGGGVNYRGGGGAGGVQEDTSAIVTPGVPIPITVGAGGTGAYYGPSYFAWWAGEPGGNQFSNTVSASNGGDSSFGALTSVGGGFGSGCYSGVLNAGNGGSGGGSTGCVAGTGIAGQGTNGSTLGGGGGAGGAPTTAGGAGRTSDITGATLAYGGGGGRQGAPGGTGGGGDGANAAGNSFAADGTDGLGGGGGGGGWFPDGSRNATWSNDTSIGGSGGSGVVIVRYRGRLPQSINVAVSPNALLVGGTASVSASGYLGTGAITYAVTSGASVCSITGSTLRALQTGSCTVTASIALDGTYLGATSAPASVTVTIPPPPPEPARPGAPELRTAVPGARQVTLTWAKPANPGTSPISAYRVYAAPGGLVCTAQPTSAATISCTVTGLSPLTAYEFWVTAINAVGESPPSNRLTATPLGPPGPPLAVAVVVADDSLSVTWDPPAQDGGLPLTRYSLWARVPGGEWVEIADRDAKAPRTQLVRNLTNARTYEFRVTARNAAGAGPPSSEVSGSVTLPPMDVDLPGRVPPQSFTVVGELPHDAELVATWASRGVCTASVSPRGVPNVIAFLTPGTCTLDIKRGSASVVPTKVGTVRVNVATDTPLTPGVLEMDVIRMTYPEDSTGWKLPKEQEAALDSWVDRWRYGWTSTRIGRQSYGGPFVYCPSIAFTSVGELLDLRTAPQGPARLAAVRCDYAIVTPASTIRRQGTLVRDFRANPRVFEVAMLPVHLPPLPPRDIKVKADAFEATITWDAPPSTERRPVDGYIAYVRPEGEREWTWVRVDNATRSARVTFEDRAWKDVPLGKDIEVRIGSANEAGRGWASTDFRLDYRAPEFTRVPDVVPPQSWVPLLERQGNPEPRMLTRGTACSIARGRFLLFIGPGRCEVEYRIDDHRGNYVRWVPALKVQVEEGAERSGQVRKLDLVNITFVEGSRTPDARSRALLEDLSGPEVEALHIYRMRPGKVPVSLVDQRESYVGTALGAWGDRRALTSWSPIEQSGLPEGDGDLIRIGYIRKSRD